MKETRTSAMYIIVALALLVPASYVGSYVALVKRRPSLLDWRGEWAFVPSYRIGGKQTKTLFWPIHTLDRQFIRREYWRTDWEDG